MPPLDETLVTELGSSGQTGDSIVRRNPVAADSAILGRARNTAGRVLLVHAGEPWQQTGAGIFLQHMAQFSGVECVHLVVAMTGTGYPLPSGFPRQVVQIPSRGGVPGLGQLGAIHLPLAQFINWRFVQPARLRRQLGRLRTQLRALEADRLVFFLNGIEIPFLVEPLVEMLGLPYATMEWDLLEHGMSEPVFGRWAVTHVSKKLPNIRSGAIARGVTSEGMAQHYLAELALDSVILRQIAPADVPEEHTSQSSRFVIAVCGNIYCENEFAVLLEALQSLEWRLGGKAVELQWIGERTPNVGELPPQVSVTGWVSHEQSLDYLRDADLGYAPLWFSEKWRPWVETSFPSKIVSYLSAEVPVLYHGPRYGSPALFLEAHGAGFICDTDHAATLAGRLESIASDAGGLAAARKAARNARLREFSEATFRDRLSHLLSDR